MEYIQVFANTTVLKKEQIQSIIQINKHYNLANAVTADQFLPFLKEYYAKRNIDFKILKV